MKRFILVLLVLSHAVLAGRAGLVVQFNSSAVMKKCIEFQNGSSAYDILQKSGLHIVVKDYGAGLGMAVCKIRDVGCEADNCFCQSNYWSFNYMAGGDWLYSDVGVSGYTVEDGDMLGFRWGAYGDKPELHSFSEVCTSAGEGGLEQLKHFAITITGNCTKQPFVISVKDNDSEIVWEPTLFFLTNRQGLTVERGVGVKVLPREIYFGKDAGFGKVAILFTDSGGNASFIPEKAGGYRLEFEKDGFASESREVTIGECAEEIATYNASVEELKPEVKEPEPNITRVDILSPATAAVNSTVTVKMVSGSGEPVAYESIFVDSPRGRKELITDEKGQAFFSAEEEGVYSYSSPNHNLISFRVTNVITPSKVSLDSTEAPASIPAEEAAPSLGMAVANPLQTVLPVLAGGIIILSLVYILRRVRK